MSDDDGRRPIIKVMNADRVSLPAEVLDLCDIDFMNVDEVVITGIVATKVRRP